MAYNYYDNFSGRASTNQAFQSNNLSNKFYHHGGIINSNNGRHYNHQQHLDRGSSVLTKNKKNMLIREERPSNVTGNVYYPGHDQPLMAMMVVDSSPSSPSSNSQEGGRGYSQIPGKQRMQSKKHNVTDKHYNKPGSASGEEKTLSRSSKKRVNGMTAGTTPALRSAKDEDYLTTKKVQQLNQNYICNLSFFHTECSNNSF